MLIVAAIGLITPWLAYIPEVCNYEYGECYSFSGWKSRDVFSQYDESGVGPFLVLFGSLIVAGLSIAVLVAQGQKKAIPRVAIGAPSLVGGLISLAGVGISWQAWNSILQYEGVRLDPDIGLWLGIIAGLGMVVMGILMLAIPKLTGNR